MVLAVDGLTLEFDGIRALDDVSLTVAPGALAALMGPNGAGKTSLLNCVGGFYAPTRGHVTYGGRRIDGLPPHRVPSTGMNRQEKEDLARFLLRIKHELGLALLWVEHDMELVGDLADHVTVLNFGRVIAAGPPAAVLRDPRVTEAYLGRGFAAAAGGRREESAR